MNRRIAPRRLNMALVVVALSVAVLAVACTPALPPETPGIIGTVTSLVAGDERPASILVEGGKQPAGALADKASVTISPSTQLFAADGSKTNASGIVKGATVKVWFEGPVAESYPVQGSAKVVQIVATP